MCCITEMIVSLATRVLVLYVNRQDFRRQDIQRMLSRTQLRRIELTGDSHPDSWKVNNELCPKLLGPLVAIY
jgi:hypothetical protein